MQVDKTRWVKAHELYGRHDWPFTDVDVHSALKQLKPGKAPGLDDTSPELLKHFESNARDWLASFFTRIVSERWLPNIWRRAEIIALPKTGK